MKIKKYGNLTLTFDENDRLMKAYSCDTCLLVRVLGKIYLNKTKYSTITSKQMTRRIMPLLRNDIHIREVNDVPINSTERDLLKLYNDEQDEKLVDFRDFEG